MDGSILGSENLARKIVRDPEAATAYLGQQAPIKIDAIQSLKDCLTALPSSDVRKLMDAPVTEINNYRHSQTCLFADGSEALDSLEKKDVREVGKQIFHLITTQQSRVVHMFNNRRNYEGITACLGQVITQRPSTDGSTHPISTKYELIATGDGLALKNTEKHCSESISLMNQTQLLMFLDVDHFSNIELVNLNLSDADLRNRDFSGKTLENIDMTQANLRGAKFDNATLNAVLLTHALTDENTSFDLATIDLESADSLSKHTDTLRGKRLFKYVTVIDK